MPWKVKSWRPEVADSYLAELERFGEETRAAVRARRRTPAAGEEITVRRTERASMRDSPLAELFRATGGS